MSSPNFSRSAYVLIPGNASGERVGLVTVNEPGYYATTLDQGESAADLDTLVRTLNERLGVPDDVAESAFAGSMFGWHVPYAARAVAFFAAREVTR